MYVCFRELCLIHGTVPVFMCFAFFADFIIFSKQVLFDRVRCKQICRK